MVCSRRIKVDLSDLDLMVPFWCLNKADPLDLDLTVHREEERELTVGSTPARFDGSGVDNGDAPVVSGEDGLHNEIRRSAVNSRAWSASLSASSGEAEGWLEGAGSVGASGGGLRRHLVVQ
jgi:hypothetical protein